MTAKELCEKSLGKSISESHQQQSLDLPEGSYQFTTPKKLIVGYENEISHDKARCQMELQEQINQQMTVSKRMLHPTPDSTTI